MTDQEFKRANHMCFGYSTFSRGTNIQHKYGPDVTLKNDTNKNDYIILEHETEPNRKTIVADLFKAAYFLQGERAGQLIVILTPKGESSFESYPEHVLTYYKWLRERTNLNNVYFILESKYVSNNDPIQLLSTEFLSISTSLNEMLLK